MTAVALAGLVARNVRRSRRHFGFASVGLVVGTAVLVFFLGLSSGIRERILNKLYPVNQVEFQVEQVRLFGFGLEVPTTLDEPVLKALEGLDGVASVHPKQRSKFQARLWGGYEILGRNARLESFFDGIEPALIRDELRSAEREVLGPETIALPNESSGGSDLACDGDTPCDGRSRQTYWNDFADFGGEIRCGGDDACPPGTSCISGWCGVACGAGCAEGLECSAGRCLSVCAKDGDCFSGFACDDGVCKRLECRLARPEDQLADDWDVLSGHVAGPARATARFAACPDGTYCATQSVLSSTGFCEKPLPVVVSPFLLQIYNDVAATALNLKRLSGLEVALGVRFAMMFGESYFVNDSPESKRVVRRCRVVGFTPKAMDFGVTLPLGAVQRANTMLKGRRSASEFTSIMVQTARNEDIPQLVDDAKVLGLTLAPRSEEGRKAANVLTILTLVFAMVSFVILAISAINITHTFLMLVSERRREIAIYRSVGATLMDIRLIFMAEAGILGLIGGVFGVLAGLALASSADFLAVSLLTRIPGSPETIFSFPPWIMVVGTVCAVVFALVGAFPPARQASRTDPAMVLARD